MRLFILPVWLTLALIGAGLSHSDLAQGQDAPPDGLAAPSMSDLNSDSNSDLPDYSQMSLSAERTARLDDLFAKLATYKAANSEVDAEGAALVAEEITALWMDSGSSSVNFILRRGMDAQEAGEPALARRMFNHVTELAPDYSQGWAKSAELARLEGDYNRAVNETLQALSLEPRHFGALQSLATVLEGLGREEAALEAYREVYKIYPALKSVSAALQRLENDLEGTAF